MGIQSFDDDYLALMGRKHFGDKAIFKEVLLKAKEMDFSVSCDLLFNLPNQTFEQMQCDIATAIDLGFDQVCIYHLVLFRLLGTEWSKNPELLNNVPQNNEACNNWMMLKDQLNQAGYEQNTLTNFEKTENIKIGKSFQYEKKVMQPEHFDWLGFGPSGISFIANKEYNKGVKLHNPSNTDDYLDKETISSSVCLNPDNLWEV
jgi:oxygen-independent coproporphyrinogen-3 oxidase